MFLLNSVLIWAQLLVFISAGTTTIDGSKHDWRAEQLGRMDTYQLVTFDYLTSTGPDQVMIVNIYFHQIYHIKILLLMFTGSIFGATA